VDDEATPHWRLYFVGNAASDVREVRAQLKREPIEGLSSQENRWIHPGHVSGKAVRVGVGTRGRGAQTRTRTGDTQEGRRVKGNPSQSRAPLTRKREACVPGTLVWRRDRRFKRVAWPGRSDDGSHVPHLVPRRASGSAARGPAAASRRRSLRRRPRNGQGATWTPSTAACCRGCRHPSATR